MRPAILALLVALLGWGAAHLIQHGTRSQTLIVGSALALGGVPLLLLARRQLGDAFAFTPEAKGLVTHGLYAKIPHPMYLFLDTALLGVVILLDRAWLLGPLCALIALQAWQARRESRLLAERFGEAYRTYRTRTLW